MGKNELYKHSGAKASLFMIMLMLLIPYNVYAATDDSDDDRLLDEYETFFHTDPLLKDTDKDGASDYAEIVQQSDPLDPNKEARLPLVDTDGDKLWDHEEVIWNIAVENPDTDGDGFTDKVELINGFNPKGDGKL